MKKMLSRMKSLKGFIQHHFFGKKSGAGFTLLEILLVVAMIAILASIVIVAVNPGKQLGDTRNAQRRIDVNTILNATYQYAVDNNGTLPVAITSSTCATTAADEICRTGVATSTCAASSTIGLAELTLNEKYVIGIPSDPQATSSPYNGVGYRIAKDGFGRVTVCAPLAEQGATITVTR